MEQDLNAIIVNQVREITRLKEELDRERRKHADTQKKLEMSKKNNRSKLPLGA